ncbi:Mobile element protein [uncultured Candidatus Thioglobus sp.]|nr:Mobile element protein [uncultured Candidatus Thioglobus sp.]
MQAIKFKTRKRAVSNFILTLKDLCINRDHYQGDRFCQIGFFIKASPSMTSAGFNKMPKLVKGGTLMIIHIYAKPSLKG